MLFSFYFYNNNLFFSKIVTLNSFKHLVYQFDMFCSSELLRYRSETQHKTLTGGFISLIIICVVVGGFASMVGDTLNRVAITSSLVTKKQSNPPPITLQPSSEKMFMAGLSIQSMDNTFLANLANGPQYFNIVGINYEFTSGAVTRADKIKFQQCTKEHWSMMPGFLAGYDSYGIDHWLCLPLGAQYVMQGSFSSSFFSFLDIEVVACNNSTSNNTCAPQADIDALFARSKNFYLNYYYINPVINPNQQDFLSYYIESNDYVLFSPSTFGTETFLLFSDYTITTDDSILPYSHITSVTGFIVEQRSVPHPYAATDSFAFARLVISKSQNSLFYEREIQKISAVLSYMGGLVGAITALLFLVKSYTDTSLEIAIGLNLFELSKQQKEKENQNEDKKFNVFGFTVMILNRLLKLFGWKGQIKRAKLLERCRQQAIKQMDVQLLLKRIIKLEICISKLFTSQQLREIRQGQNITFKSARNMRMLLLKEQMQADSEEQESSKQVNSKKEQQINDVIDKFNPSEESAKWKQKCQLDSGDSIYKLKPNKYGQFLKRSQLHIEEAKIVTRKAILQRRQEGQNENGENWNGPEERGVRNPIVQLTPIII